MTEKTRLFRFDPQGAASHGPAIATLFYCKQALFLSFSAFNISLWRGVFEGRKRFFLTELRV